MCDFAIDAFELNCGVVDTEFLPQDTLHLFQNLGTLRRRDVGDDDVSGTGVGLRSKTPHVQVVHIFDPLDGLKRNPYLRQRTAARCSL